MHVTLPDLFLVQKQTGIRRGHIKSIIHFTIQILKMKNKMSIIKSEHQITFFFLKLIKPGKDKK